MPAGDMPALELPDPAISPEATAHDKKQELRDGNGSRDLKSPRLAQSSTPVPRFQPRRTFSLPGKTFHTPRPAFMRRMFSNAHAPIPEHDSFQLASYRELDARQDEFFYFLDTELEKIESFYRLKEAEATSRLRILRDQLHEMRDRRVSELAAAISGMDEDLSPGRKDENGHGLLQGASFLKPIEGVLGKRSRFGKTSKAMDHLGSPSMPGNEGRKDYTRRFDPDQYVTHRSAKRKLKVALQELYKAAELLKSYALVNRTAFRKINKKYDKAVNARPTGRYMSDKVNKAYFVKSEVLEGHIVAIEDLFARYFERGNRKVAVGKLRSKLSRTGDYSGNTFRNGLFLATGLVFGIEGLVSAANHLSDPNSLIAGRTAYLLQVYAGYFLALFLVLVFSFDCRIWTSAKVNYIFIFEYDTRHALDWRQLAELPCFFLLLEGLFLWLNFRQVDAAFIWWPLVLIGLTLVILFFPAPILYHRTRRWWAYSNWRLLLAGVYPVEFRDFFLGDMYCSETYTMGNIELFFCLYARDWTSLGQCNSSNSRLLGFFATLPGIWRALQCIRRYYDSRNWFPHLVNCGKYSFNILYYMSLSLWRINRTHELHALFITCALINAVYCSIWDVAMDWSLGNPYARHPFLRDTLAFRRPWVYYAAMVVDPILRFQWIFYVIYADDVQHSAVLSFIIAFAEVIRRGIWSIFRVENEHCTNVGRFRASRDVPLPYSSPTYPGREDVSDPVDSSLAGATSSHIASGTDAEQATHRSSPSLRRRHSRPSPLPDTTPLMRGLQRMGSLIVTAHAQDFQRKKRPGIVGDDAAGGDVGTKEESSDEEEEEMADEEVQEGAEEIAQRGEYGDITDDTNEAGRNSHRAATSRSQSHQ